MRGKEIDICVFKKKIKLRDRMRCAWRRIKEDEHKCDEEETEKSQSKISSRDEEKSLEND